MGKTFELPEKISPNGSSGSSAKYRLVKIEGFYFYIFELVDCMIRPRMIVLYQTSLFTKRYFAVEPDEPFGEIFSVNFKASVF